MKYSVRFSFVIILILLLSSINVFPQSNYFKGYYTNNDGDTIKGFIEYRTESKNASICKFRKNLNSAPITLGPGEVKSYGINRSIKYITHSYINESLDIESLLFYKVLVEGSVSLLTLPTQKSSVFSRQNYFIRDREDKLYDLSTKNEIVTIDGKEYLDNERYARGVLLVVTSDYANELQSKINNTDKVTSEEFLKEIIVEYNELSGSQVWKSEEIKNNIYVSFEPVAGAGYRFMNFSNNLFKKFSIGSSPYWGIGLNLPIFLPRINEDITVVISAYYSQANYYSFYQFENYSNDLIVDLEIISARLGLQYNNLTKMKLLFNFGLNSDIVIQNRFTWREEEIIGNVISTSFKDNLQPIGSNYFGLFLTMGKSFNITEKQSINASLNYSFAFNAKAESNFNTLGLRIGLDLY